MHQFKINGKMAFEGDVWQWHQDYGTWKNDDLMPTERAMNVGDLPGRRQRVQRPADVHPGSHRKGVVDAKPRPDDDELPAVDGRRNADRAVGRSAPVARKAASSRRRARPVR
jgi:hypothetical protein